MSILAAVAAAARGYMPKRTPNEAPFAPHVAWELGHNAPSASVAVVAEGDLGALDVRHRRGLSLLRLLGGPRRVHIRRDRGGRRRRNRRGRASGLVRGHGLGLRCRRAIVAKHDLFRAAARTAATERLRVLP